MNIIATIERYCTTILKATIILVRPLLGPASCRFYPGCTTYALEQLKTYSLVWALMRISKRLLACQPLVLLHLNK